MVGKSLPITHGGAVSSYVIVLGDNVKERHIDIVVGCVDTGGSEPDKERGGVSIVHSGNYLEYEVSQCEGGWFGLKYRSGKG